MLGRFKGIALATTALSLSVIVSTAQSREIYWDPPTGTSNLSFQKSEAFGAFTNWKQEEGIFLVPAFPNSSDLLVFGDTRRGVGSGSGRNDLENFISPGLKFASTAGSFRLSGDRMFLGVDGLTNLSDSEQNIDFDVLIYREQTWSTNGGTFDINGDVRVRVEPGFGDSNKLTITGSGTTNIDGDITGTSATEIEKNGNGTLVLDGDNSGFLGDIDLSNGRLRLDGGDNISASTNIDMSGDAVFDLNGTAEDIGGLEGTSGTRVDLSDNASLRVGLNNENTTYDGNISGNGTFIKGGDGTTTLTGNNTYTGGTTVQDGTLRGDTVSLRGNITNNANLVFNNNVGNGIYTGNLSGDGTTTFTGGFRVELRGNNGAATGDMVVTGGTTLRMGPGNAVGDSTVVLNNGELDLNGTVEDIGGLAGSNGQVDLSDSADLGVGYNNESTTFNGSITGNGSLRKEGTGTLTLRGTNSYTGGTSVNAGGLEGDTDSLQGSITNSSFLIFDQDTSGTFNGTINGVGSVTKRGNGTVTLAGPQTYTGGTRIERGTLRGTTDSLTGDLTISSNSGVEIAQDFNASFDNTVSGNGRLTKSGSGTVTLTGSVFNTGGTFVNEGTLRGTTSNLGVGSAATLRTDGTLEWRQSSTGTVRRDISGTGGVTISGGGTVQFDGNNSYQGVTRVSGSTLRLGTGNALSSSTTVALSNGTLDFNGTAEDFGGLSGSGTVDLSSSAAMGVGYNNADTTFSGAITGNGTLRKEGTGTLTLIGNNSYSGATTVNNGQLRLTGTGNIDQSSSLTVGANGTFSAQGFKASCGNIFCGGPFPAEHGYSYGGTVNNQGVIRGGNGVTSGTGTGALTLTGAVSGAGSFENVVAINGTFRPGNSPALITAETLSFGASNSLFMEIGGYGRGSEYDAFDATSITLNGLLDIALLDLGNSFSPMSGDTFDLIVADQIFGEFSSFNFAALAEGLFFTTQLITTQLGMVYQLVVDGQLVGVAVPAPGTMLLLLVGVAGVGVMRKRKAA